MLYSGMESFQVEVGRQSRIILPPVFFFVFCFDWHGRTMSFLSGILFMRERSESSHGCMLCSSPVNG